MHCLCRTTLRGTRAQVQVLAGAGVRARAHDVLPARSDDSSTHSIIELVKIVQKRAEAREGDTSVEKYSAARGRYRRAGEGAVPVAAGADAADVLRAPYHARPGLTAAGRAAAHSTAAVPASATPSVPVCTRKRCRTSPTGTWRGGRALRSRVHTPRARRARQTRASPVPPRGSARRRRRSAGTRRAGAAQPARSTRPRARRRRPCPSCFVFRRPRHRRTRAAGTAGGTET